MPAAGGVRARVTSHDLNTGTLPEVGCLLFPVWRPIEQPENPTACALSK